MRLKQAREDNLPYEEFLFRLLSDEVERRDGKQLEQRIRRANFEHARTLEDFDFHFNPNVPKAKVIDLATCGFIEQRQNVLLTVAGAPGLLSPAPLESRRNSEATAVRTYCRKVLLFHSLP